MTQITNFTIPGPNSAQTSQPPQNPGGDLSFVERMVAYVTNLTNPGPKSVQISQPPHESDQQSGDHDSLLQSPITDKQSRSCEEVTVAVSPKSDLSACANGLTHQMMLLRAYGILTLPEYVGDFHALEDMKLEPKLLERLGEESINYALPTQSAVLAAQKDEPKNMILLARSGKVPYRFKFI